MDSNIIDLVRARKEQSREAKFRELMDRDDLSDEIKHRICFWGIEALESMLDAADRIEEEGLSVGDAAVRGWMVGYIHAIRAADKGDK